MRTFRQPVVAMIALAALAVAAPGASAKATTHGLPPTISPAKPVATDTLNVRFRAPAGAANSERYAIAVRTRAHRNCQSFALVGVDGVVEARDTATVHLLAGTTASFTAWCTGPAVATLLHRVAGGGWAPIVGARRAFKIAKALDEHELFGTKVQIDVLGTSTATVKVLGRADRVLSLSGAIDGFIPGKFILNSDYKIQLNGLADRSSSSALVVSALVTDPLCSAGTIRTIAPLKLGGGSSLTVLRNGSVAGTFDLASDPGTLAACAGPDTGTTTLDLKGLLGVANLADLTLNATLPYVPVGGGTVGTVSISLHLKITILD